MVSTTAVRVEHLRKEYGRLRAVDDLSFTVDEGEVFAIVGPNGAGKTTTVEILEGHRQRSGGHVSVLGFDPATGGRAFRERIGIVLQEAGFDEAFTVRELVALYAGFYPRRLRADDVIDMVGLADKRDARVKTLSGGQRRRLDLALGLVGDPQLLFLDEPTTGFDPAARRRAWDLVERLRALDKTILLTTHSMEEVQHLADRVAVIASGRLVAIGSPDTLTRQDRTATVVRFQLPEGVHISAVPRLGEMAQVDGVVELRTARPVEDLNRLTGWALANGVELRGLTLTQRALEEAYLELVEGAQDTSS
jgi:ABC-2 type transport system ATP-binding protein